MKLGLTMALALLMGSSCPKKDENNQAAEPVPAPPKKDCSGWAVYGPPPCSSDEDCLQMEGEGWYCNREHYYTNPCDEKIPWPLCEPKK
jgi:hypothetical protein